MQARAADEKSASNAKRRAAFASRPPGIFCSRLLHNIVGVVSSEIGLELFTQTLRLRKVRLHLRKRLLFRNPHATRPGQAWAGGIWEHAELGCMLRREISEQTSKQDAHRKRARRYKRSGVRALQGGCVPRGMTGLWPEATTLCG